MEEIALVRERGDDVDVQWVYLVDTAEELVKSVSIDDTTMAIRKKFIDAVTRHKKAIMGDIGRSYYNLVMDLVSSTGYESRDDHFISPLHMRALSACRNEAFVLPSSPEMANVPSASEIPAKKQRIEEEEEKNDEGEKDAIMEEEKEGKGSELMVPIYTKDLKTSDGEEELQNLPMFYSASCDLLDSLDVADCGVVKPPNPLVDEPYIPDIDPCFQTLTIVTQVQRKKVRKAQASAQEPEVEFEFVRPEHQIRKYAQVQNTGSPQKVSKVRASKKKVEKYKSHHPPHSNNPNVIVNYVSLFVVFIGKSPAVSGRRSL